jgi:hypothetical protein
MLKLHCQNTDIIYASYWGNIGHIVKTVNGGLNWDNYAFAKGITDITLSYTNPDSAYASSSIFGVGGPSVFYTYNGWVSCYEFPFTFEGRLNAIEADPQYSNIVYTAGYTFDSPYLPKLYKTTNGGQSWSLKNNGLSSALNAVGVDPIKYVNIYCGGEDGLFKTIDAANNWVFKNSGLLHYYNKDIEIDPEEPVILYALMQQDYNSDENYLYCSVDGAAEWFQFTLEPGQNPPVYINDLTIDNSQSDKVYAATPKGTYVFYPQYKVKHLTSSTNKATSTNSAKKMIRGGVDDYWITYESGGVIYAVHSDNGGTTWSRKMEIGYGCNPAISSNPNAETPIPGIVWWAQGTRDTIYFARHISDYNWTLPTPIVTTDYDFGPPSFVVGTDSKGRVVYANTENDNVYYTEFDFYIPDPPSTDPDFGSGINPSIGFMNPGGSHPEIHVVWEDNNKIRYRSRTVSGTWGDEETVSTNNSHHPSIEVAGTNVYVVWERFGDIYRKYAVYTNGRHYWTRYESFSTDYRLDYPVFTGGNAMSCFADVNGKGEIYFWYNAGTGWVGPINISNSPDDESNYPHIVHKQTVLGTIVYFTWAEKDNAPFDVMFENYTFGGSNPDEDLAFYIAEGGEIEASPFNLHREGYVQYGTEFYKRIDYDTEYLEYQFEMLKPEREYALAAYAYQEGYGNLPITVKIDNILIGNITLPPESLIVYKQLLPENLYADTAINVKIFGNDAVCVALVIYEYEQESGKGGGGPQSADNALFGSGQLMLNVFPNPAHKEFTVQYTLPKEALINLSIFDVTGRLVSALTNSAQKAGTYGKTFNTRNLPQGVYFIRLNTGEQSIVKKTIFLK